jgi:hypothetical protein
MKHVFTAVVFLLMYFACVAQEPEPININFESISTAIENNETLGEAELDFSKEGAAIVINLPEGKDKTFAEEQRKKIHIFLESKKDVIKEFLFVAGKPVNMLQFILKSAGYEKAKEGDKIVLQTSDKKTVIIKIVNKKTAAEAESDKSATPVTDYWKYHKEAKELHRLLNLEAFKISADFCCDACKGCEDTIFKYNNRIVYDALSGLTYFAKYKFNAKKNESKDKVNKLCTPTEAERKEIEKAIVRNGNRIKLKAGDPVVFIVKNVNPAMYNTELSDSSFLVNIETNELLNSGLVRTFSGQGKKKDEEAVTQPDDYLTVKSVLIRLNAEMKELVANYELMSRTANNCIQQKKAAALIQIDSVLFKLTEIKGLSLNGLADLYLTSNEDKELSQSLKDLHHKLIGTNYTIAYRFPRVPEADQIHYFLSIIRKENAAHRYPDLLAKSKTPTQVAHVTGFFKVDVSSGLYYGALNDSKFSLRKDSTSTTPVVKGNRIVQEDVGKNEFGFASYVHLYYKFGAWVNAGLNIGAGVNFEDKPKPRYFAGASIMIGSNNRLCINGGAMWGKAETLSDQYPKEADGSYKWLPESETQLQTKSKLKCGWFLSVSYNLPFLKKGKGVESVKPPAPASGDEKEKEDGGDGT